MRPMGEKGGKSTSMVRWSVKESSTSRGASAPIFKNLRSRVVYVSNPKPRRYLRIPRQKWIRADKNAPPVPAIIAAFDYLNQNSWLKTGQNFGLQYRGELPTFSIMSELIEGLPDAVALRCLERVPFYLHPKLEQVSHSWRAVVQSTELFKVRQEVNSAEEFLCVCAYDPENLWQLYDPLRDLWISLPVLPTQVRHLAYFGVVATAGKLFVLGGGSDAVCSWWWQTYDKDRQCWTVYEGSWLQGPMAVVQGEVYVMSHGLIHKQVGQETKAVISASEFRRRIGFAMIGLGDDIYVIGGVIGPEQWNWDIKMVSDVDVLTLGSERPIWRQASPMNRCRGTVFGCTRLRI